MYKFKNKVRISMITMLVIVFGCLFVNKSASKVLAEETNTISEDKLSALSVKCQVKKNADGSADLRLVSTVDALELYGTAGFDIYVEVVTEDGENELQLLKRYEKPYVTDSIGAKEDGVSFEYNPKVFDAKSNYFITVTVTGIPESDFDCGFLIKPFVTESGNTQRLYGVSRYVKVNDAIQGNKYLSVPVVKIDDTTGCSIKVGDNTYTSGIEFYSNTTYDGNYTHVRVQMNSSELQSITKVSVLNGEQELVNTTYRNLYSTASAADTTWYDNAEEGTTKYVLATKADLLGLSTIVNDSTGKYSTEQFGGKTIYLGADLTMNDMTASEMKDAIEDEAITDPLLLTPIGKSVAFEGEFDGLGQTISGIAISEGNATAGLFGYTNGNTAIMNLNLRNGYLKGTENVGSIAGQGGGTFNNVSSDALIDAVKAAGGIIGLRQSDETTLTDCSFRGTITATDNNIGGMVGLLNDNTLLAINGCVFAGTVQTTKNQVGGMIGGVGGKSTIEITGCNSTGTVVAGDVKAGGFIGYIPVATKVAISESLSSATVTATGKQAGGFIGMTDKPVELSSVHFSGNATGLQHVGGFVGAANNTTVSITDGLMTGTVQANITTGEIEAGANQGSAVGGICGIIVNSNADIKATRCLITGTIMCVATDDSNIGEHVGRMDKGKYTAESVCVQKGGCASYEDTDIAADTSVGSKATAATYEIKDTCMRLSADELKGEVATTNASGLFGESTWTTQAISTPIPKVFHWYYSDTSKAEFVINNVVEFFDFAKISQTDDFTGKTICLGDNIVVNEGTAEEMLARATDSDTTNDPIAWTPIGTKEKPFAGSFDGQNHTISGIYINNNSNYQGLFSYVGTCTIQNLQLDKSYIKGKQNVGSIAGGVYTNTLIMIKHVTSSAYVTSDSTQVGGILGLITDKATKVVVEDCTYAGTLVANGTQSANIGGIVGLMQAKSTGTNLEVTNCTFSGNIEGGNVGGFVGGIGSAKCAVTITSCHFTSDGIIHANTKGQYDTAYNAGGIIGKIADTSGTTIKDCTVEGTVKITGTPSNIGKYIGLHKSGTVICDEGANIFSGNLEDNIVSE